MMIHYRYILPLLYLSIGCCHLSSQTLIPNQFGPPMDIPAVISGSFGELRPNHFHSGIDFATNGRNGYNIISAADGFVSRIKVSATGYGKAVYITHPNGYTTVYGHLDNFSSKIDSFTMAKQYELKQFEIDVTPKSNAIRVKKGEVVGYSGNTGSSGGPHLHYEIRDTYTEKPINPLLFRRDAADTVKPVIQGIRIYPLGTTSLVQGKAQPHYFKVVVVNGVYKVEGNPVINASGKVGFGVEVIDYMSGSWRKCGVYSISLKIDETEIFKSEMERFAFDETRYINSHIDYGYKMATGRFVQKSFIEPNNKLKIYTNHRNNGEFEVENGLVYDIVYNITDSYGNTSVLTFKVKGTHPDKARTLGNHLLSYTKSHKLTDNNLTVLIPENCFYTDVDFPFKKLASGNISEIWQIGNRQTPLHVPITVEFKVPESYLKHSKHLALARVDSNGKLIYIGGNFSQGKITSRIRETGNYSLAIDTVAPTVSLHKPAEKNNYSGKTTLELMVKDNFSGISNYDCFIDDNWALFEYDAKTNRLICPLNRIPINKKQNHTLRVEITDGCGNKTTKNFKFYY